MNRAGLQAGVSRQVSQSGDFVDVLSANLLRLGISGRVLRIDISRSGDLTVQAAVGGQQLWLQVDPSLGTHLVGPGTSETISELTASTDRAIPLSRQLCSNESTPGLTVLSYLPGRRLVILDSLGEQTSVLKGYRKGKGERAATHYDFAAQATIPGQFICVQPLRFNALHDFITLPLIEGRPFQISEDRSEDFEELGNGIRQLQSLDGSGAGLGEFNRQEELDVLDERVRRMQTVACTLPEGWQELRARIETFRSKIPIGSLAPAHRDLHDGQLLRSPDGIALLDFDLLSLAEAELDPANFLAHLSLRRLQKPHRISDHCVQVCGRKFLNGLDAYQRDGFWERLRFYQATSFCRLQLVYALRPRWSGIIEPLGRLGHRCLDDLQHLVG